MKKVLVFGCLFLLQQAGISQKKPLDHSVYDAWQSIGERIISNDGRFIVYAINPQEGDGVLVVQGTDNSFRVEIPRGYSAKITADSRFVICKVKPFFKDSREARIKKKKPEEMPKDSLAILEPGKDGIVKIAGIKSYKVPEKNGGWIAYLYEKAFPVAPAVAMHPDSLTRLADLSRMADSLSRVADSIRNKTAEARIKGMSVLQPEKKENKKPGGKQTDDAIEEGTELVLRNLTTGSETVFPLVKDYAFSKKGKRLLIETTRKNNDTLSEALLLWLNTGTIKSDTVMKRFHDAVNFAMDEDGTQLAFVAERDSVMKALRKFYKLWYFKAGMDSAQLQADRSTTGVPNDFTISENYGLNFSKDGKRLFLGLAPIRPPKDTTLVDFETARLDVWHYNDDYLPPQQLLQLNNELKRSYLAVAVPGEHRILPLADENCENVMLTAEGNGLFALGRSTKGYRVQQQWEQNGIEKLYVVNTTDGTRKQVADKVRGIAEISPGGKFIVWYDWKQKNWFSYSTATAKIVNITSSIRVPLFDEEDDHPDDPAPHGLMGWEENDRFVYVYDKYDVWKCDPEGGSPAVCATLGNGRKNKVSYRFVNTDPEKKYFSAGDSLLLQQFDFKEKYAGFSMLVPGKIPLLEELPLGPFSLAGFIKAKNAATLSYLKGSFDKPMNVYTYGARKAADSQLSDINPQQKNYNWLTVELKKWKMFDGKMSEGLLYKPENFDSTKKYPVIFYFYERDADTRYSYIAPQPVRSSINISYFVSNGYLVFDPDIHYRTGQPGEDAYNAVISAAKYLGQFKWVDTTRMGLQGHSWGGYQVAYLVTRTHLFAAAEAGAPVANMTSAYGGIRWGTGISREFQYEHSQSRLGATLWQRPDLYIKNSPLFRADKVSTPLLMMHNDADGAVPWYQGIEYFTALRRLGKKVWMMEYNGEDHGLQERRNRKDWSIRMAQFFDHYLKGAPSPKWMTNGVPATLKGIDWGLQTQ